ncbi:hypothetical protein D3C73_1470920 [compost metagenome]
MDGVLERCTVFGSRAVLLGNAEGGAFVAKSLPAGRVDGCIAPVEVNHEYPSPLVGEVCQMLCLICRWG